MKLQCVSLLMCALLMGECCGSRLDRWVRTGLQYLKLNLCRRVSLPESECKKLSHLHLSGVAVYVTESGSGKCWVILPDSYSSGAELASPNTAASPRTRARKMSAGRMKSGYPARVRMTPALLLDPSPGESFGHPVALFYVDFNTTTKKCAHMDGIYLGEWTESVQPEIYNHQSKRGGNSNVRLLE